MTMRLTHLGAAALMIVVAGGGDFYSDHAGEALRSNAGFTRENPPPVGPPVSAPARGPGNPSDVGDNAGRTAPTGGF
jgi:hypothetical protein